MAQNPDQETLKKEIEEREQINWAKKTIALNQEPQQRLPTPSTNIVPTTVTILCTLIVLLAVLLVLVKQEGLHKDISAIKSAIAPPAQIVPTQIPDHKTEGG